MPNDLELNHLSQPEEPYKEEVNLEPGAGDGMKDEEIPGNPVQVVPPTPEEVADPPADGTLLKAATGLDEDCDDSPSPVPEPHTVAGGFDSSDIPPSQPKEHHILDPLADKVLGRLEQDQPFGLKGKGRKPKAKPEENPEAKEEVEKKVRKPRAKAQAKAAPADPSASSRPSPKRRGKKLQDPAPKEEEVDGQTAAPKRKARKAKAKASPKKAAKAKGSPKKKAAKAKASPKKKSKSQPKIEEPAQDPEAPKEPGNAENVEAPKPKRTKRALPTFKTCALVPYGTRNAFAIKVRTGNGVSGMSQAGWKGVQFKCLI